MIKILTRASSLVLLVWTPSSTSNLSDNQAAAFTRNKVFTIYMEHGAKKSVLLNPMEPIVCNTTLRFNSFQRSVLEKICISRGLNLQECVAEDMNGNALPLNTKMGQVPCFEITFVQKGKLLSLVELNFVGSAQPSVLPLFIDDVLARAELSTSGTPTKSKRGSEKKTRRKSIKLNRGVYSVICPHPLTYPR